METFKIEIFPDFAQRKELKRIMNAVSDMKCRILSELARQYNQMNLFQSEALIYDFIIEQGSNDGLTDQSIRYAVHEAYQFFLAITRESLSNELKFRNTDKRPLIDIPKSEVIFSVQNKVANIPYLGLARYRPNLKYKNQVVRKTFLCAEGSRYFILVDCRDDRVMKITPRLRKRPGRAPVIHRNIPI